MPDVSVTWLGHASFRVDSPNGKRVYVDPWLDNPKCPDGEKKPERADVIAVTHGHSDHVGSAVAIAKEFSTELVTLLGRESGPGGAGAGGDDHGLRERWFGATGRRVPELAVEGDPLVPLGDALVLDDVSDAARLRAAHAEGTPVVVRADSIEKIMAALRRPEVASVL